MGRPVGLEGQVERVAFSGLPFQAYQGSSSLKPWAGVQSRAVVTRLTSFQGLYGHLSEKDDVRGRMAYQMVSCLLSEGGELKVPGSLLRVSEPGWTRVYVGYFSQ